MERFLSMEERRRKYLYPKQQDVSKTYPNTEKKKFQLTSGTTLTWPILEKVDGDYQDFKIQDKEETSEQ